MIKIIDVWNDYFSSFVQDIVENINSVDLVILDCLNEFHYTFPGQVTDFNRLLSVTSECNVPVKILSSRSTNNPIDLNAIRPNVELIIWETFFFNKTMWLWTSMDNELINLQKGIDIKNLLHGKDIEIIHPYICLNNIVKRHRQHLIDLLAKHDIIKDGIVSWRGISNFTDTFPYKYWKKEVLILDQGLDVLFRQETLPTQYNHTFMQLVSESEEEIIFFSEKTCVPIFFNKPFLIAGSANMHMDLKRIGFELYDELYDYSFDSDLDQISRYEKIIENIKPYTKMKPNELQSLYRKSFDKMVHNKQHAIKLLDMIPDKVKELKELIVKNNIDYSGPLNNVI